MFFLSESLYFSLPFPGVGSNLFFVNNFYSLHKRVSKDDFKIHKEEILITCQKSHLALSINITGMIVSLKIFYLLLCCQKSLSKDHYDFVIYDISLSLYTLIFKSLFWFSTCSSIRSQHVFFFPFHRALKFPHACLSFTSIVSSQ